MRSIFRDPILEERFNRRGYVVVPLLEPAAIEALSHAWNHLAPDIHSMPFSASIMSADEEYRSAVHEAIAAAFEPAIANLLDDYRFCFGNFVVKRAQSDDRMPLHQDLTFVEESRYESINLWVPLSAVVRENGCLRVMPGSHRLNLAPRGTNRRFPYPELEEEIMSRYLVDVEMPAGSACVMSQRTFHTSYLNGSPYPRVAASALAVPRESDVYYMYQIAGDTTAPIDVFRVDDDFYRAHVFGAPANGYGRLGSVEASADPLNSSMLEEAFQAAMECTHHDLDMENATCG